MKTFRVFVPKAGNTANSTLECWKTAFRSARPILQDNRMLADTSFLRFLLSNQNRSAALFNMSQLQADLDKGDGIVRNVARQFFQSAKRKALPNLGLPNCNGGSEEGCAIKPYRDFVTIDKAISSCSLKINEKDWKTALAGKTEHIALNVANNFREREQQVANAMLDDAIQKGYIGKWGATHESVIGGLSVLELPVFETNGKSLNPTAKSKLKRALMDAGLNENAAIFGSGIWSDYSDLRQFASANQNGYNAALASTFENVMPSDYVGSVLPSVSNVGLMIAPGSLQVVTFNQFGPNAIFENVDPKFTRTITPSSFSNQVAYDTVIKYVCEADGTWTWSITYSLIYGLLKNPDCLFEDSKYKDANGIMLVRAICSDEGVCDIPQNMVTLTGGSVPFTPTQTDPTLSCVTACKAAFRQMKLTGLAKFAATIAGKVSAVQINAATTNLSRVYELAVPADVTALKVELSGIFSMLGGSLTNLTATAFEAILPAQYTDIELVIDGGANIEATRTVGDYVRFVSGSTATTGAAIATIGYTIGALTIPASAPTAQLAITNVYGQALDFYVDYTAASLANGAAITHTVVDNSTPACTNTVNSLLAI